MLNKHICSTAEKKLNTSCLLCSPDGKKTNMGEARGFFGYSDANGSVVSGSRRKHIVFQNPFGMPF